MTRKEKKHLKEQTWSFFKTYVTVFLGILLYGYDQHIDIFDTAFLIDAGKVSLISVFRNILKFLNDESEKMA